MARRTGIDTEKQFKRQSEWVRENRDRIQVYLPKGLKEQLKAKATAEGKSLNEWIVNKLTEE